MASLLGVSFEATAKVIVAVLVGVFTCNSIPHSASTMRDFSFLITSVLLPALTVTNMAMSVNAQALIQCSVLLLFSGLLILIGIGCAIALSYVLFRVRETDYGIPLEFFPHVRLSLQYDDTPIHDDVTHSTAHHPAEHHSQPLRSADGRAKKGAPFVAVVLSDRLRDQGVRERDIVASLEVPAPSVVDYPGHYWGAWIGCSIQNCVTLPVSLFLNLSGSLAWIDQTAGTAYIFVFSIMSMVYIWTVGPWFVETAQKQAGRWQVIRTVIARHQRLKNLADASTQTEISCTAFLQPHQVQDSRPTTTPPDDTPPTASRTDTANSLPREVQAEAAHSELSDRHDCSTTTKPSFAAVQLSPAASPTTLQKFHFPQYAGVTRYPYDWAEAGHIRVQYESDLRKTEAADPSLAQRALRVAKNLGNRLLHNMPFMAIAVGMTIGIIPFLRSLFFDGGYLGLITDAVVLVGQGNIPASLLLLGANLVGSSQKGLVDGEEDREQPRTRDSEQNTHFSMVLHETENGFVAVEVSAAASDAAHEHIAFDVHASFSLHTIMQAETNGAPEPVDGTAAPTAAANTWDQLGVMASLRKAMSLTGISKRFVWGIIVTRLVVIPAMSFVVLVLLHYGIPFLVGGRGTEDRTLMAVLFVELSAPTAINSALLFQQRQFMTRAWATMLFFQYLLSTVSMVAWTSLGLWYVERL